MIVSFAIVAFNEQAYLPSLLEDLKAQDYPHNKIEVLLIDSMSTDNTKNIMEQFKATTNDFLSVKVLPNPKKIIPCGHNVALDNYTGDALIRIDAHASMPSDFRHGSAQEPGYGGIRQACFRTLQAGQPEVPSLRQYHPHR